VDKKFRTLTLEVHEQVLKDLETEAGLAKMCGQAGGLLYSFACKLISEAKKGTSPIRITYKNESRGQ
jgi:hypothetical protein